jgi:hypothetical protein
MTTNDDSNALAVYEPPPREMTRLKAAFSGDLKTVESIKEFATICRFYDLDPFIGEIVPMHGRIYVEEAGWLRHIQQKAPGQLVKYNAGMCDKVEREAMGIAEGTWLAWGEVVRRYPNGTLFPVRELATVTKDETAGGGGYAPIAKEPWRMAMKRARVRALRIAFREVLHADAVEIGDAPIEVEAMAEEEPLPFDSADASQPPASPTEGVVIPPGEPENAEPPLIEEEIVPPSPRQEKPRPTPPQGRPMASDPRQPALGNGWATVWARAQELGYTEAQALDLLNLETPVDFERRQLLAKNCVRMLEANADAAKKRGVMLGKAIEQVTAHRKRAPKEE